LETTAVTQYFQLLHLLAVAAAVTAYHLTMAALHLVALLEVLAVVAVVVILGLPEVVVQRLQAKEMMAAQDCHPHREVAVVEERGLLELVQDRGV
jgi:hypothetical protein